MFLTKLPCNVIVITNRCERGFRIEYYATVSSITWRCVLVKAQTILTDGIKVKKRGHPVGRLGAHIKHGIGASYEAYLREERRVAGLVAQAGACSPLTAE